MKILVTGGAGFLGSHLCRALISQGHEVIALDNLDSGSESNLADLASHQNFTFLNHDACMPFDFSVDQIYNLAAPASPVHYQKNPIQTTKTIVLGAMNVLDLAHRTGARVLQASTSEIYGDPEESPQQESYWGRVNPIGVRACYDESKRCAETLFFDYWRMHQIEIKVVRLFNTYGPGMQIHDGRVVTNFIYQALNNQDLTIYGNGEQTRSLCYVDDTIEGLITVMNSPSSFIGPVNIGNNHELTVAEIAHKVIALTKSSSGVVFHELPQDDPQQRKPDIGLASELGWSPKTIVDEGLAATIDYYKKQLTAL